ncbi:flavodoxin reductases (ferredoxin-NADPH reductases) family 1 [Streptomyces sp. NL15-2K]|nr:flavodoxin reductases (ferredoxin-NADPH reductases) family 1 [Streptomyces sp. NL15-2K]
MSTLRTEVERDLVLERKETVAEGVVLLTLSDAEGRPLPEWQPGAHVDLILRADLVRQYSLCGDPGDRSRLQVAVLREPKSRGGSSYVHDELSEGESVRIRGPRNNFPLVKAKRYLFIAGGIGITPILPMVAAVDARGADWRLVYGGRTRASMAFGETLQRAYGDRVSLRPQDEYGLLDLPSLLGKPQRRTAVYSCGPETAARGGRIRLREVVERSPARGALRREEGRHRPAAHDLRGRARPVRPDAAGL